MTLEECEYFINDFTESHSEVVQSILSAGLINLFNQNYAFATYNADQHTLTIKSAERTIEFTPGLTFYSGDMFFSKSSTQNAGKILSLANKEQDGELHCDSFKHPWLGNLDVCCIIEKQHVPSMKDTLTTFFNSLLHTSPR